MADTITVTYKVNEDGSLQKITKRAENAASATDKVSSASGRYSKQQKGVAGATSNSTKAFSKMTTGITGGLVPAYAALAANIFAISAAFNFFKRAADVKILEEGQIAFGKNTGFALRTVTAGLREASGGMLGFREAAEAAAIGVAKGFSPKQLEDLAVGARKASAALGRNFEDSFDRLIRGASKAEPELLDELGITLKLADATETYGNAINKNAKDLTAFERSQAVLIETQRQLDAMYGDMAESTNPFVELSKTFEDLVKSGTNFLLPIFEGLAKIINGSAIAAVAVFGAIGVAIVKTMIPMGSIQEGFANFKQKSQESLDSAMEDQKSYQAELAKTKAAVEASKAQGIQSAAKSLGGPSKLVQKAAAGNLTDPKQIGQLKAHLKKAEIQYRIHGEITKGVFEGADLAKIQSLKKALDTMGKDHMSFFQRIKMGYKSITLTAKVTFSKIQAFGTRALSAVATAATKMGNAMNKAMKLAGFIGMFMMIVEIGQQLMQAPMDIVMGVLRGLDFIIKAAMKGIGMAIDAIGNVYKGAINAIIMGYNMVASTDLAKSLGFKEMGYLDASSTAATDAMENLADSTVNLAGAFESSSFGNALQGFQDRRVAAAEEAQAYEDLKEAIRGVGTELDSIAEGLAEQSGAKKEKSAATALATLGLSRSMSKALDIEDDDKRANAVKLLKKELKEMENISPAAMAAINEMDVETMQGIEMSAQSATGGLSAMHDSIRGINASLSSGNLLEAEFGLEALALAADGTSTAFQALFGEGSAAATKALADFEAAFSGPTMTSSEFLQNLKDLRVAQEALAISQAKASLVQGQYAKTFGLQNALSKATLDITAKELELEKEKDLVKKAKIEQELELLRIAKENARISLVGQTQGSGMAAVHQSDALKDQGLQARMSPMLGQLEKLGPEGELISSVVNGAFAIQEAFGTAFEEIGKGGLTMETGLAAAATAVHQIGGMMAASSKAKIANIDQEIAAEKKRDGKSQASVAKIAALEKKKEDAKRKAFENDKKMQMAQIVIATATAIQKSVAASPTTGGMPFAAIAAAIGAAQLAIVAGTSYQGGGASAGGGAPTSISIGSRKNTVDMAKSQSARGELAYMRGERGSGGPENFRPAFSGYKHSRATGGYVVGEQGPELFMPEVPGQIIPSGQGVGGQTNVSFTINSIDSVGMEEALISQRGNIIGMIREASNSYGQDFIEEVDTSVFTQNSVGVSRY